MRPLNAQEGHMGDGGGSAYQTQFRSTLIQETRLAVRDGGDYVISGDYLLYEDPKVADIQMNTENLITLRNVNYNVIRDEFYYKDPNDNKFYALDFNNGIKRIIVGNDIFENVPKEGVFKTMQVLYENDNMGFFKNYFIERSRNNAPTTIFNATDKEKYDVEFEYYIQRNYVATKINLTKRDVLGVFQSGDLKDKAKDYMKANDLSFKDEHDVKLLFGEFFK